MSATLHLSDLSFLREVEKLSGAEVSACLQCHKCSAGCPVGTETDLRSSQIMRLIHFGEKETLLASKAIWLCASCEACTSRCPMDIDVAAAIDTLRAMAVSEGAPLAMRRVDAFNRSFLKSMRRHGRVFEMGMMVGYSFKTGDLFSNLGKATKLLVRGRLAFSPSKSDGAPKVKQVMKAVKQTKRGAE